MSNHVGEIVTNISLKRQHVTHYMASNSKCNCIFWAMQEGFSSILLDHQRLNHTKVMTTFAITFSTHLSPNILAYDDTCVMHEWTHMMHTYYVDF
jgi:hypothetical protein